MQKIIPCLWFDSNAEEAVAFYSSIFKDSKILTVTRYGKSGPGPEGMVMTIVFKLEGQVFMALNGGPQFKFTEAVSLMVKCETQAELDVLWDKLSDGGQKVKCGWVKDKFGLSWQITPTIIADIMREGDPVKADKLMKAILPMKKIDIDAIKQAVGV